LATSASVQPVPAKPIVERQRRQRDDGDWRRENDLVENPVGLAPHLIRSLVFPRARVIGDTRRSAVPMREHWG